MKLECVQEKLKTGVMLVEKITSKNLPLPVLKAILLEADKKTLTLKATNLDVGIEFSIPAKVEQAGSAAVPGSVFGGVVGMLSAKGMVVRVESLQNNLHLSTPQTTTIIKTLLADDFPRIPRIDEGTKDTQSFSLKARDFVAGLEAVSYAASFSDVKPEIASVCVAQDEDALVFAATDSFRLAEKRIRLKKGSFPARELRPILIPVRNTQEIVRAFSSNESEMLVVASKNQVSFSAEGVYLTSRLVDGVFPDYGQIVPKGFQTEAVILKDDCVDALRLANVFSDRFNQIHIRIIPGEHLFEFASKNQDVGESVSKIEATVTGDEVDNNFNARYIMDCFQSIPEDSVSFHFSGKDKPLVIRASSGGSFTYLVMPLHK